MVWLNGEFVSEEEAKVSVFDHGFLYGDGVYETIKVEAGQVKFLREHLRRLRRSAQMLSLILPYGFVELKSAVETLVKKNGGGDLRLRITLTRGVNEFDFGPSSQPTLCIVATKFIPESLVVYEQGVEVITVPWMRLLPEVKSISLLPMILVKQLVAKKNVFEVIFMDEKKCLKEGSVTNIFFVTKKQVVIPKDGYLEGIQLQHVIKKASKKGYRIIKKDFSLSDVLLCDGIFLTNVMKGVVPISKINGKVVPKKVSYQEFL